MARLPVPGGDDDTWGNVLNDFLGVSLNTDGTFKNSSVTSSSIAANAVGTTAVADTAITEAKLSGAVQTKLNANSTDATTLAKGVIQLAGDLGGTAAAPTVPGLAGKANTAHTHTLANITDVTATATELNYVTNVTSDIQTQLNGKSATGHTHTLTSVTDVTATAAELNKLDGATVTTAQLNYVSGVTSDIQTQLNGKQAAGSYAASSHTHTLANITDVTATATELNYTTNVTSDIQTQLNGKSATGHTHTLANITDFPVAVTATELGYLNGVTSAIQTQFTGKSAVGHTHTVSNLTDYPTQRARMEKSTTGPAYSSGTWTKVTGFDAADFASGITADATNGNFTIVTSGIYDITFYQRWQDYGTAYYRLGAIMLGTSAPPTGANGGANGAILALSQAWKTDWYVDTLHAESIDLVAGNVISFWVRSGVASTWNSAGDTLVNKPPYVLIRRVSA